MYKLWALDVHNKMCIIKLMTHKRKKCPHCKKKRLVEIYNELIHEEMQQQWQILIKRMNDHDEFINIIIKKCTKCNLLLFFKA